MPHGHAEVQVDIRTASSLRASDTDVAYVATIADCGALTTLIVGGEAPQTFSRSDTQAVEGEPDACALSFSASGSARLTPGLTLRFADGTTQNHGEVFQAEANAPQISFESASFAMLGGKQQLVISVRASDDADVSFVNLTVVGLRASDLRAAGGIIERAAQRAFANTMGARRLVPTHEGQELYQLALPITSTLSGDEIAHNGLVLVEGEVVDASGNVAAFSKMVFTGGDVVETVSGLAVQPTRLVFTNLLETATLMPSVDFQFRGPTPLPGVGQGVTYTSSRPDLVAVSAAGVAYPIERRLCGHGPRLAAQLPMAAGRCADCERHAGSVRACEQLFWGRRQQVSRRGQQPGR